MFFFSSRRRHTRSLCDWSSDVCSSDLDAVAVVAADTWAAKQGLAALDIRWDDGPNANLTTADIVQQLATASEKSGVVARKDGDVAAAMAGAGQKVEAIYEQPFLAHATMEPVNCTVHVRPDGCDVWV